MFVGFIHFPLWTINGIWNTKNKSKMHKREFNKFQVHKIQASEFIGTNLLKRMWSEYLSCFETSGTSKHLNRRCGVASIANATNRKDSRAWRDFQKGHPEESPSQERRKPVSLDGWLQVKRHLEGRTELTRLVSWRIVALHTAVRGSTSTGRHWWRKHLK